MNLRPAFQHEFRSAMADLYGRVDADVAGRQGVCMASGRCCRFEEYGHRLYVTHAELIYFYATYLRAGIDPSGQDHEADGAALLRTSGFPLPLYKDDGEFSAGCPWQVQGMCTARNARPLGCRIYFCDAGSRGWQGPVYEYWHQQFTAMHARFGIDYGYVEWRHGLSLLRRALADSITDQAVAATGQDRA